jgi:hypothetical protein
MTLGTKGLLGPAAGLAAGIASAAAGRPGLGAISTTADVAGTLWINAILMTILPLAALVLNRRLVAMEPGHFPYRKMTIEDHLGTRGVASPGRSLARAGARLAGLIIYSRAEAAAR